MNIEELVDKFLKVENDYGLFEVTISGAKVWPFFRATCFWDVQRICTGINEFWYPFSVNEYTGPWNIGLLYRKYIQRNFVYARQRDVLIFSHSRKILDVNGHYKDVYTHAIDRGLKRSHYVIDRNLEDGAFVLQDSNNILTDDMTRYRRLSNYRNNDLILNKQEIETRIIEKIEEGLDIHVDNSIREAWLKTILWYLQDYPLAREYYAFLIKRIKPKVIMVVTYYDFYMQVLIETAKRMGVQTVELQHGLIGRQHISYNFYKKMNLDTFPDYVFCFGEYDKDNARWPIKKDHIIPVGYPELEMEFRKYENKKLLQEKKIILFISGYEEVLSVAIALYNIIDRNNFQIIFKCHPSEYSVWETRIAPKVRGMDIEVIHDNNKPIYYYLGCADWVVGDNSTVLFEATLFDTNIVILKDKSSPPCECIAENGEAMLVENENELLKIIMNEKNRKENKDCNVFFERNSIENINSEIDLIINNEK